MKRTKNLICLALSLAMLLTNCIFFSVAAYGATTTTSWNMSNSAYSSLGTISSTTTVNSLEFIATSSKTMSVSSNSVTVDSTAYTYALSLGGAGSTSSRAIATTVSNGTKHVIKVTAKSTGSDTRTLNVVDESGNVLGTISASSTAATGSITTTYNGKIYIYSTNSGINIYKLQIDTTEAAASSSSSSVTVTNFADLVTQAKAMASTSGGGTVYVNAKSMSCDAQLLLSGTTNPVSIVGVKQSDGTYPVLDFKTFRSAQVGSTGSSLTTSAEAMVGVKINGANYTIKDLIIQKAPDKGLLIKGANAKNNTVENVIVRYNNNAGLVVSGSASNNTIKYVFSYRNCDVYTRGQDADGFAPKLGATTGNTFYACYAWDNSDDGWDSYDKTDSGYTQDLVYEECAAWNNGNPNVFTGKYDYDSGKTLDTDLFLVELISKNDSSFATNYSAKSYTLSSSSFINTDAGKLSASNWVANFAGSPNGFKMGSAYSQSSSTRTFKNCLAYNNASKGFDNNNSALKASLTNTVAFDNGYNYHMPNHTFSAWSNVRGFSGNSSDKLPSGYSASTPASATQTTIRSSVDSTISSIVSACQANKNPGKVVFSIY